MIFSVYVLQTDPDYAIFDRQLSAPPEGRTEEFDCAAVFQCEAVSADIRQSAEGDYYLYCVTDTEFRVSAYALLVDDFMDSDRDELSLKAGVKRLWPDPE